MNYESPNRDKDTPSSSDLSSGFWEDSIKCPTSENINPRSSSSLGVHGYIEGKLFPLRSSELFSQFRVVALHAIELVKQRNSLRLFRVAHCIDIFLRLLELTPNLV